MAELTPLDEKLGEVLGLAQAAQEATTKVAGMEGADEFKSRLERMSQDAAETERRTDELVDSLDGKKTAIREKAADTKSEAKERRSPMANPSPETSRRWPVTFTPGPTWTRGPASAGRPASASVTGPESPSCEPDAMLA